MFSVSVSSCLYYHIYRVVTPCLESFVHGARAGKRQEELKREGKGQKKILTAVAVLGCNSVAPPFLESGTVSNILLLTLGNGKKPNEELEHCSK